MNAKPKPKEGMSLNGIKESESVSFSHSKKAEEKPKRVRKKVDVDSLKELLEKALKREQ